MDKVVGQLLSLLSVVSNANKLNADALESRNELLRDSPFSLDVQKSPSSAAF
jgi:hypothetical protein